MPSTLVGMLVPSSARGCGKLPVTSSISTVPTSTRRPPGSRSPVAPRPTRSAAGARADRRPTGPRSDPRAGGPGSRRRAVAPGRGPRWSCRRVGDVGDRQPHDVLFFAPSIEGADAGTRCGCARPARPVAKRAQVVCSRSTWNRYALCVAPFVRGAAFQDDQGWPRAPERSPRLHEQVYAGRQQADEGDQRRAEQPECGILLTQRREGDDDPHGEGGGGPAVAPGSAGALSPT